MATHPSIEYLESYRDTCITLKEDIDLAIQDHEFVKGGGTLRYAVDFSEIYSYVLPADSYKNFILFPDAFDDIEEVADATALQQLVLQYIFFDLSPSPKKLILLSPYVLEFRTFVQSLQQKLLIDSVDRTLKVFKDLEGMLEDNRDSQIDTICQNIELDETYTASDEEQDILAKFVQRYGYIESFLEGAGGENHPYYRVKQLRPETAFTQLKEIVSISPSDKTDIYDRWVASLYDLRRKQGKISSAELDATAINLIYHANLILDQKNRLLFVTRSGTMHELYKREVEEGLWKTTGNYPLVRHPRMFSIARVVTQKSNPSDLQDLKDLRETIDLFLETYKARNPKEPTNDQELINLIDNIKQDWKNIQKIAFSLFSRSASDNLDAKSKIVRQAKTIINYARSNQAVKNKIVNILDGLFYDIEFVHDVLGLELQLPYNLQNSQHAGQFSIQYSPLLSPQRVIFYTKAGKDVLHELSQKPMINTDDIIAAFKKMFDPTQYGEKKQVEYERNLAMAYLLGTLINQWGVAGDYCLRAIAVGEKGGVSVHEAIYYLATCKREEKNLANRDEEIPENWLTEVLNLLDQAISVATSQGINERVFSRYWTEKGISIILFHKKSETYNYKVPGSMDGVKLLREWTEKLDNNDDLLLKLFALRILLDYLYGNQKYRDLVFYRDRFTALETQLLQFESDQTKWAPYVSDLILWGKWVLFPKEYDDSTDLGNLIKQLRIITQDGLINKEVKDDIFRHIKDVEKKLSTV